MQTEQSPDYSGIDELLALERALRGYNAFVVSKIEEYLGDAKRIADFGAGIGTLAQMIRQRTGISPVCVEIDATCKRYLSERGFEQVERIGSSGGKFQAIYSSNVLEHIEDDVSALREINEALEPGGRLVLYLPAFQVLFSGMDESVGHYRRYGRREIIEKCERAGFTVERSYFCDCIGFFANLTVKTLGYDRESGLGSDRSLQFYDKLVFPISRVFDVLGFKYLFGKNVMVVARKD